MGLVARLPCEFPMAYVSLDETLERSGLGLLLGVSESVNVNALVVEIIA